MSDERITSAYSARVDHRQRRNRQHHVPHSTSSQPAKDDVPPRARRSPDREDAGKPKTPPEDDEQDHAEPELGHGVQRK